MALNYNPYNYNPYNNNNGLVLQDLQSMRDRIDRTMQQYQQNQFNQPQQQVPQVTQHFQLAPSSINNGDMQAKYVTDVNEVKNTFVMSTGLFLDKNMNTLWVKNANGDIRTFTLTEQIEKDEKDVEIDNLKKELNDIKYLMAQQTAMLHQQQIVQPVVAQSQTSIPEMKIEPEKKVVERKSK